MTNALGKNAVMTGLDQGKEILKVQTKMFCPVSTSMD